MKAESSVHNILWSLACLVFAVAVLHVPTVNQTAIVEAQQSERKSVVEAFGTNPQLKITKLRIISEDRDFKEEFDETDDWTRRISFEIDSLAPKPITFIQINLKFPD